MKSANELRNLYLIHLHACINFTLIIFKFLRTIIDNLEKMVRIAIAFYRYYLILILSVQCLYNDIIENDDIIRG